jgi:osomolarity two-component system response regulator SSK1
MGRADSSDAPSGRTSLDSSHQAFSTNEDGTPEGSDGRGESEQGSGLGPKQRLDESTSNPGDSEGDHESDEEDVVPPIFSRSYSSPLPARVKSFQKPSRLAASPLGATPPLLSHHASQQSIPPTESMTPTALQTLSAELSDSLQSAIQTLLHLSPPHLLDNAKEQYSGCTVQLPTTSLSALLTAMKGLNYLSANVASLCQDAQALSLQDPSVPSPANPPTVTVNGQEQKRPTRSDTGITGILDSASSAEDFDIGELLQSTADLLSGQAAQAGVELVLFHGDVGIKHVSVHGDGEGLGYALSYVSAKADLGTYNSCFCIGPSANHLCL